MSNGAKKSSSAAPVGPMFTMQDVRERYQRLERQIHHARAPEALRDERKEVTRVGPGVWKRVK